jgi:large subunit ribosomal protein L4
MISIPIRSQSGQETGANYEFDPAELAPAINKQLLHDAVVMYENNLRQGTAKSKSRAEIAGSSKKMYKQKGTGRARMGNKRTPVRRGGGHAFAKRPKDWSYRMPRKALQLATRMALVSKFLDGEAIVVEAVALNGIKTKEVAGMLKSLGIAGRSCTLATETHDPVLWKSARNIPDLSVAPAGELTAYTLLRRKHFVVTKAALDQIRDKNKHAREASARSED